MAMMYWQEDRAKNLLQAQSILSPSLNPVNKERLFEISFLAKENLPFTKFSAIHDLQE